MLAKPIAVITGAASGLGLDLARQMAQSHYLILIDIQQEALQRHSAQLPEVAYFCCDLSNASAVEQLINTITSRYERIDVLINNAGITHRSLTTQTHIGVLQRVMAVDYFAPVQLTQGLLPLLLRSRYGASVVNIGSMAGWMPVLGRAGYCAAKSALHQYFETLRAELSESDLHILMVYPSFLDTPIAYNALNGQGERATHARSTVGNMKSSWSMAEAILDALKRKKKRLFSDYFTFFSSILYRLLPSVYLRLMRRRLAVELTQQE